MRIRNSVAKIYPNFRYRIALIRAGFYDKLLGIETSKSYASEDKSLNKDMCNYQPAFYGRLENIASYLKLTKNDIFIDLGCGTGRAVFFMALQGIKKAVGVEIDRKLIDEARKNLSNFRRRHAPIEFINVDVSRFKIKDESIFFLFNPFGPKTLGMVINNIKDSLIAYPRRVRIVYYAPAHKDLLDKQDWLFFEGRIRNDGCLVWGNKLPWNFHKYITMSSDTKNNGDLIFIETSGFSMWPFLKAGQKLIVKKTTIESLGIGDIILYRVNNQSVCHRLIKKIKDKERFLLYARGDSSVSLPELVTEDILMGKVIGSIKNGKTINLNGKKYRLINRLIVIIAPLISVAVKLVVPFYAKFRKLWYN